MTNEVIQGHQKPRGLIDRLIQFLLTFNTRPNYDLMLL